MPPSSDTRVPIRAVSDVVTARLRGRDLAARAGFGGSDQVLIATAISELARNILTYARQGDVILRLVLEAHRRGVEVVAEDRGPGIADVDLAMQPGYSTSRSLGLGLPGTRRLMDEFAIVSEPGKGTAVTVRKWVR